ncbi:MAG: amidohydrolase [Chloroflexi bacterium]|nr:amidohydrolase [Chloroflexota bacterium]
MIDLLKEAQELFEYTQSLRRDFHKHPELGFQEVRTAGKVAKELNALGLEVSTGIAETGVVALIEGSQPGPVVLLRFDMDALPIEEETGADYASLNAGVMHACGHDGHTAIGLTAARLLHKHSEDFSGIIKLVFQPAEEGMGGAERMVAEGVLENPRPDYSLGLHLWNEFPLGRIGVTPGPAMAGADTFRIVITGTGGHGAAPNLSVDPVLAASQVVVTLQSIVSRNVDPIESSVLSVTTIRGGEAFNVIPEEVELMGTIRSYKPEIRDLVLERFYSIVKGVSESMGCEVDVSTQHLTPPVVNDEHISRKVQAVVETMFPDGELDVTSRTMGSEDMSYLMDDIPGCYIFVGSNNPEKGLDAGHHNPHFDFDEGALPRGAALITAAALDLMKN